MFVGAGAKGRSNKLYREMFAGYDSVCGHAPGVGTIQVISGKVSALAIHTRWRDVLLLPKGGANLADACWRLAGRAEWCSTVFRVLGAIGHVKAQPDHRLEELTSVPEYSPSRVVAAGNCNRLLPGRQYPIIQGSVGPNIRGTLAFFPDTASNQLTRR